MVSVNQDMFRSTIFYINEYMHPVSRNKVSLKTNFLAPTSPILSVSLDVYVKFSLSETLILRDSTIIPDDRRPIAQC